MHPACPNKKQNHLQNSLLRRTQFWVRKSFSKPASLKGLPGRCALLPFCAAPHGKGFCPLWGSPSPCCGCCSGVCRYCAEVFSFGVILNPLDTARAACVYLPSLCCFLLSCSFLSLRTSPLSFCGLHDELFHCLSGLFFCFSLLWLEWRCSFDRFCSSAKYVSCQPR